MTLMTCDALRFAQMRFVRVNVVAFSLFGKRLITAAVALQTRLHVDVGIRLRARVAALALDITFDVAIGEKLVCSSGRARHR